MSKCLKANTAGPPFGTTIDQFWNGLHVFVVVVVFVMLPHREGQDGDVDRGDKSFSCGHPVWGLAFGPRAPKSSGAGANNSLSKGNKTYDGNALLLATGLENGTIKIWNVFTGELSRQR